MHRSRLLRPRWSFQAIWGILLLGSGWLLSSRPEGATAEPEPAKPVVNSVGLKLVRIPAGKFLMGSPASEEKRARGEAPQHEVVITKAFWMGVYEVTQGQYLRLIGKNPSTFKVSAEHPVEMVSWDEAVEFCKRLSELPEEKKAGRRYRLPTEAEWEYACRAGTTTPFHYGDSLSSKQANFNGEFPYGKADKGPYIGKTVKVGSYQPNAWGLYDMHGNLWEWIADWYDENYYAKSPKEDPKGPEMGQSRVLRGACWRREGPWCRSARRHSHEPFFQLPSIGFRVVCDQ